MRMERFLTLKAPGSPRHSKILVAMNTEGLQAVLRGWHLPKGILGRKFDHCEFLIGVCFSVGISKPVMMNLSMLSMSFQNAS